MGYGAVSPGGAAGSFEAFLDEKSYVRGHESGGRCSGNNASENGVALVHP